MLDGADGEIVVHSFSGDDWRDIKAAWCQQGLIPEWQGAEHSAQRETRRCCQQAQERQQRRIKEQRAETLEKTRAARDIFRNAIDAKGSVVETYARSRGITVEIPLSIRCARGLKHGPTGLHLPAMVAAVQNAAGQIVGVHRTFLTADGRKKAPVSQNKMMLGPCAGGAVRLALAKDRLCIGEGLETMLSVQQETDNPCWAALSTSSLKALILPYNVTSITICVDADKPGEQPGIETATSRTIIWPWRNLGARREENNPLLDVVLFPCLGVEY